MSETQPCNQPSQLLELLGQWRTMVQAIADKGSPRERLDEHVYQRLHGRLVEACQHAVTAREIDGARREVLFRLGALLRPWVNLESLEDAGPDLIRDLVAKCEAYQSDADPYRPNTHAARWGLLLFASLFVVAFGIVAGGDVWSRLQPELPGTGSLDDAFELWQHKMQDSRNQVATYGVGALAAVFTAAIAYWVFRPPSNS